MSNGHLTPAATLGGNIGWRVERVGLLACLAVFGLLGFLVRIGCALLWPKTHRPDEVFQNLEPAYRLWTGWGVVTWEWREGIRSWLFPDFLYGIMQSTSILHLPSKVAVPAILASLSAVSLSVVVVGILIGWRQSGMVGAALCGTICAFWPDLVYFGPRPLVEIQAGHLLVMAAGLTRLGPARGEDGRGWRVAAIGLLLGLGFDLRFQLAPALGLVAIVAAGTKLRRGWLPLLAGAALPLFALGVSDALAWGTPFQSIWKNLYVNFVQNKSAKYGLEPFYWYATEIARTNGAGLFAMLVFFCVGARREPLMAAIAVIVLLSHTVIGHKEISFVYAALPAAAITAGLGTASLVDALRNVRVPIGRPRLIAAAIASWLAVAGLTAVAERPFAQAGPAPGLQSLWGDLKSKPDLCGVGLYGTDFPWYLTPGYTGLERSVPMYLVRQPSVLAGAKRGFNYAVTALEDAPAFAGWDQLRCSWRFCLLRREGDCTLMPDQDINHELARRRE